MKKLALFLLPIALASITNVAAQAPKREPATAKHFKEYFNDRFGFSVDYPADFKEQPPPENNDGQEFRSIDEKVQELAWGEYNDILDNVKTVSQHQAFDKQMLAKDRWTVTYQPKGSNWYVLSGKKGQRIMYQRTIVGPSVVQTVRLEYPANLQSDYASIVERIARSLTAHQQ